MDKITAVARGDAADQEPHRRLDLQEPAGHKAWQLIDAAGCRGLTVGGAQVSELHCNFLINLGGATAADIETLGETVRRRVQGKLRRRAGMGNQADRRRRHDRDIAGGESRLSATPEISILKSLP